MPHKNSQSMKKAFLLALAVFALGSLSYATNVVPERDDANSSEAIVIDNEISYDQDLQANTSDIRKGMKYKEIKNLYNPKEYMKDIYDPYNPAVAGVCSALIPGLGQILDGEVGRGLLFMLGSAATAGAAVAFSRPAYYSGATAYYYDWQTPVSIACLCGAIAFDVWAICDAVKVGKIKNMYNQDLRKLLSNNNLDVSLSPSLAYLPTANGLVPTAGLSLKVVF